MLIVGCETVAYEIFSVGRLAEVERFPLFTIVFFFTPHLEMCYNVGILW